jgi:hypothetical protein
VLKSPCENDFYKCTFEGTKDEYVDLAIHFGFCSMFASAFPAAGLLTLISMFVESRIDVHKLCNNYRRAEARGAQDIGPWQTVFELMAALAVFTNAALIIFSTNLYTFKSLWPFVLSLCTMFAIKVFLDMGYSDLPFVVRIQLQRNAYIMRGLFHGMRVGRARDAAQALKQCQMGGEKKGGDVDNDDDDCCADCDEAECGKGERVLPKAGAKRLQSMATEFDLVKEAKSRVLEYSKSCRMRREDCANDAVESQVNRMDSEVKALVLKMALHEANKSTERRSRRDGTNGTASPVASDKSRSRLQDEHLYKRLQEFMSKASGTKSIQKVPDFRKAALVQVLLRDMTPPTGNTSGQVTCRCFGSVFRMCSTSSSSSSSSSWGSSKWGSYCCGCRHQDREAEQMESAGGVGGGGQPSVYTVYEATVIAQAFDVGGDDVLRWNYVEGVLRALYDEDKAAKEDQQRAVVVA